MCPHERDKIGTYDHDNDGVTPISRYAAYTNGSVKSELNNGRRLPYKGKCNKGRCYLIACTR
jgi:hypothetical protein